MKRKKVTGRMKPPRLPSDVVAALHVPFTRSSPARLPATTGQLRKPGRQMISRYANVAHAKGREENRTETKPVVQKNMGCVWLLLRTGNDWLLERFRERLPQGSSLSRSGFRPCARLMRCHRAADVGVSVRLGWHSSGIRQTMTT